MARPHPHKRAARLAAFSILCVVAAVAAVWSAPRLSDAVAAWMNQPPVTLRTAVLQDGLGGGPGGVRRDHEERRGSRRGASGHGADRRRRDGRPRHDGSPWPASRARRRLATAACRVLLRTSQDGRTWSRWYGVTLERAAEEGEPEKAFTEPIWTGAGALRAGRGAARRGRRSRAGAPARRARGRHQQQRGRGHRRDGPRGGAAHRRDHRRPAPHADGGRDDHQAHAS